MALTFMNNAFPDEYIPTVFDNMTLNMVDEGQAMAFDIWDTAGGEDYDRLRPLSYPGTNVFLIAYSVVNPDSYNRIADKWIPEVTHHMPNVPIIIVGTKIDLRTNQDALDRLYERGQMPLVPEDGESLAKRVKAAAYLECSSLTQEGLQNVFATALRAARGKHIGPVAVKPRNGGTELAKCAIM